MSTVISVENLGKKYTLHHQQRESYRALRDVLTDGVASIGQKLLHPFRKFSTVQQAQEEFWALKDVSFEVKQGDRIGIIGRNGAGKSTLLKILSRITEPTTGRVKIKGRVASLLEVGTGFHPELTGRENIYLNGAILGMKRVEIKKKFDEIVVFAEIEKFLDTPVKRYSSGMYVRLAFAVAAHLEPEILVVDEVLAVGDAQFQRKCLGKMGEVAQGGRTVLFVSHNMPTIATLCNNCVLLQSGSLAAAGTTLSIIDKYLSEVTPKHKEDLQDHPNRAVGSIPTLTKASICGAKDADTIVCGQPAMIRIEFDPHKLASPNPPEIAFTIETATGFRVLSYATYWSQTGSRPTNRNGTVTCKIEKLFLSPGMYSMNIAVGTASNLFHDHIPNAIHFEVSPGDYYGTGKIPTANHGVVFLDASWRD